MQAGWQRSTLTPRKPAASATPCCSTTRSRYARSAECSPAAIGALNHSLVFVTPGDGPAQGLMLQLQASLAASGFSVSLQNTSAARALLRRGGTLPPRTTLLPGDFRVRQHSATFHALTMTKPWASELLLDKARLLAWLRETGLGHLTPRELSRPGKRPWEEATIAELRTLSYPLVVKAPMLEGERQNVTAAPSRPRTSCLLGPRTWLSRMSRNRL